MQVPGGSWWLLFLSSGLLCWACQASRTASLSFSEPGETVYSLQSFQWQDTKQMGAPGRSFADAVAQSFFPYRDGPVQVEGIRPGVAVSLENWRVAEHLLPPEILRAVKDGELTILVQEASDLPVSPEYIEATIANAQHVSLDEAGHVTQYRAGLPFPLLDPADPQAGLKAAWDARYADKGKTVQRWESLQLKNSAGEYQFGFSFFYAQAYGMHRADVKQEIPDWVANDVLYKEFMQVFLPVPGSFHPHLGFVHLRYWHDQETHPVGQWYITEGSPPRRNRALLTLAYDPEASAWKFPLLYEDFVGAPIHTYHWRLLASTVALVPGFVQGDQPLFGSRRIGYPLDPWELRTVYVVEATPRFERHPYSRKVFFFDQQTFAPCYMLMYDREGKHWRTAFFSYANPQFYPGAHEVRVPILIGRSWIDFALQRATLAVVEEAKYNDPLSPDFFSLANMMRKGK